MSVDLFQRIASTGGGVRGQAIASTRGGVRGQAIDSAGGGVRGQAIASTGGGVRGQAIDSTGGGVHGLVGQRSRLDLTAAMVPPLPPPKIATVLIPSWYLKSKIVR